MRASRQDGTHPRPQLVRDEWESLDGTWSFAYDDDDRGRAARWFRPENAAPFDREITVPFAPESAASGIHDERWHPVVWYRRVLRLAETAPGTRRLLHLGAVDHDAQVWVDGSLVAEHRGGQTSFTADITDALADGAEHVVVVRAYDDPTDPETARGKQDWLEEPHATWYARSTGIWRSVWLETVPEQHVARLHWSTDRVAGTVTATIELARTPAPGTRVRVALTCAGEPLGDLELAAGDRRVIATIELPGLRNAMDRGRYLWSPERPVLLDADVVLTAPGSPDDRVASYLGIRSTEVARGWFLLNGVPYRVRSVLQQGYWPDSLYTAPSDAARRDEIELIKSLGFNAVRLHQKVEDPRMIYWADRLGLLVWGETASAYAYSPAAAAAFTREWTEIVEQYRDHPSIVTWVPFNESWGVQDLARQPAQRDFVQALTSLTRALDPGRPVISNDGWEHVDSDILGIHEYSRDAAQIRRVFADADSLAEAVRGMGPLSRRLVVGDAQDADAPVMLTEFGGVSYSRDGEWGYIRVDDAGAYEEQLRELFGAVHASPVLTGFCYTQLTDTRQEANGLVEADRTPKLPVEVIRSIVMGPERMRLPMFPEHDVDA